MQSSYLYKVDLLWRIYNGAKSFRENTFQNMILYTVHVSLDANKLSLYLVYLFIKRAISFCSLTQKKVKDQSNDITFL